MNLNNQITDNTSISGKYKTVGQVKRLPQRSAVLVVSKMKNTLIKEHLLKFIYEKYYLKIYRGNLTTRIKDINTKACYYHILNHCFDGIDPLLHYKTKLILNSECKDIIQSLHKISPSGTGIFMDYLFRRIISEIRGERFEDTRANKCTRLNELTIENDKQLWQFNAKNQIGRWNVTEEPDIQSIKINSIQDKDRFIELDRKDEWLKIKYKNKIGWVRYLVPVGDVTINRSGDIKDYIPNKWFDKIEDNNDRHYCKSGCKTKIKKCMFNCNEYKIIRETGEIPGCTFPLCQNICYMKAQDTQEYNTKDIIKEIYILSCVHTEAFYECPPQDKFDKILDLLDKIDSNSFISPLFQLCNTLLSNVSNVLLNPTLGDKDTMPADCDLVLDNTLADIKCTKNMQHITEILQLLAYNSLINKKYNIDIKNVCIINLLLGVCVVYNVENISKKNSLDYLNLLTNKYDKNQEIELRTPKDKIEFPPFVKLLNNKDNYLTTKMTFPYYHKLPGIDLNRYGIYKSIDEANENNQDNCFLKALKHGGASEETLQIVRNKMILNNRHIKTTDIKYICEEANIYIRIKKRLTPATPEGESAVFSKGKIKITSRGNASLVGIPGRSFYIGLIDEHYFLIDKLEHLETPISMYCLKNWDRMKENLPNNYGKREDNKKARQKDCFSCSFKLVEKLLDERDKLLTKILTTNALHL